jgi:deazaflavin-dependent oxidoreductase (nitroreductase family)
MTAAEDWNTQVINEFRANGGEVGGQFAGAPLVLLHHTGRKSGHEYIVPLMYQGDGQDSNTIYIFASKAGAPTDPEWYHNVTAAGTTTVEVGAEAYPVTVTEVTGERRDAIYAEQARRFPGFAEYETKVAGIRTIPVVALTRS